MFLLSSCPKQYREESDKACTPHETISRSRAVLDRFGGVLAESRRIDTGRLGIPVYLSMCGPRALSVMPTRKQMGKGASPVLAEASALMELIERFSYFTFWSEGSNFVPLTWTQAAGRYPNLMDLGEVLRSTGETMDRQDATDLLDLVSWRFAPALNVTRSREEMVPLDWFKKLNEFNGSSAGNTPEEAILQGACELVERHVSTLVDRRCPVLPTIDPSSFNDPVLTKLHRCFTENGIKLVLKDFTLGYPVPTVGALAYDPANFPGLSEIVFTAGTASSPTKAAIRAMTEIAQLAGDFHTGSNYEASGLSKYTTLEQARWIWGGDLVALDSLPTVEDDNILVELRSLCTGLERQGFTLFSVDTTHPDLSIPSCYNVVPGFLFRERTPEASLGLFIGRILAEEHTMEQGLAGLGLIERIYPQAPFLPFFHGMLHLRAGDPDHAITRFLEAAEAQHSAEDRALSTFYAAYVLTTQGRWGEAIPLLDKAIDQDPLVQEYFNLRGVARYRCREFEPAAGDFQRALSLNGGSAMDYANLGLCYKAMARHSMAADFLRLALEIDDSLHFAREALADLRSGSGKGNLPAQTSD
jgi:ribosomal protein S12 methylthiotransferase accessory factor